MKGIMDSLFNSYFTLVHNKGKMGAEGTVFLLMALIGLDIFALLIYLWRFFGNGKIHALFPTILLLIIFYCLNFLLTRRYITSKKYKTIERGDTFNGVVVLSLHWLITIALFVKLILY
jgi:hypothetical protein